MKNTKIYSLLKDMNIDFILKSLPGYVYLKNPDSVYIGGNQNFGHLLGVKSEKDINGISELATPWATIIPETAFHNIKADRYVLDTGRKIVTEENIGVKNTSGLSITLRSEKLPLIDKKGNIFGVIGTSLDITEQKQQQQLNLEIKQYFLEEMTKINLTKRELECAIFLVKGLSRKMIASELNISLRTVECYINQLKEKTKQYSQDALVHYLHQYVNPCF